MLNIKTELTVEQAGLVVEAIDQMIAENAGSYLNKDQVHQLAQVAHNLEVHIRYSEAGMSI